MFKKLSFILSIIIIFSSLSVFAEDTKILHPQSYVAPRFVEAVIPYEEQINQRRLLSSAPVSLYEYLYNQFYAGNTIIDIEDYGVDIAALSKVYNKVTYENPELFVNTWSDVPCVKSDNNIITHFQITYLDVGDVSEARQLLTTMIDELVAFGNRYESDIDKILAIHDEIIRRYEYWHLREDETDYHVNTTNAYSFAKYGEATCQAYSQLFNVVMKKLNINTEFCSNNGHQWSLVELGGKWYHIDLTWDDPLFSDGQNYYKGLHRYFLVSDDTMVSDPWGDSHKASSSWVYTEYHEATDKYFEENTIFRKLSDIPTFILPASDGIYKCILPLEDNIYIESGIKADKIMRSQPFAINKDAGTFNIWLQGYDDYESESLMALVIYYDENGNAIKSEKAEISLANGIYIPPFLPYTVRLDEEIIDNGCKVILYIWNGENFSPYSLSSSVNF